MKAEHLGWEGQDSFILAKQEGSQKETLSNLTFAVTSVMERSSGVLYGKEVRLTPSLVASSEYSR